MQQAIITLGALDHALLLLALCLANVRLGVSLWQDCRRAD